MTPADRPNPASHAAMPQPATHRKSTRNTPATARPTPSPPTPLTPPTPARLPPPPPRRRLPSGRTLWIVLLILTLTAAGSYALPRAALDPQPVVRLLQMLILAATALLLLIAPLRRAAGERLGRFHAWRPGWRAKLLMFAAVWLTSAGGMMLGDHLVARQTPLPVLAPLSHDEESYALQTRMAAAGHLWLAPHPMARYFESFHIQVEGAYGSIYFPGNALLQAPGVWLGWPWWRMPQLLSGLAVAVLFLVGLELFNPPAALAGAMALLGNHFFLDFSNQTMAQTPVMLAGLLCVLAWAKWRGAMRFRWSLAAGAAAGLAAIIRPVDAVCFAAPVAVAMLLELSRRRPVVINTPPPRATNPAQLTDAADDYSATNSTKSITSTHVPDGIAAAEMPDATNSNDSTDGIDATDATALPNATDVTGLLDTTQTLDATQTLEATDAIDATPATDAATGSPAAGRNRPSRDATLTHAPRRAGWRCAILTVVIGIAGALPFLSLQWVQNAGMTGRWTQSPYTRYLAAYHPNTTFGFAGFDPSLRPAGPLVQKQYYYDDLVAPPARLHTPAHSLTRWFDNDFDMYARVVLASPLLLLALVGGMVALAAPGRTGSSGRTGRTDRWVLIAAPLLFVLLYSFYPFAFPHYGLPMAGPIALVAGGAFAAVGPARNRRWFALITPALVGLFLFVFVAALPLFLGQNVAKLDRYRRIQLFKTMIADTVPPPALVLVRLGSDRRSFDEPVYNLAAARIDDNPVVLAQLLPEGAGPLLNYYAKNQPWRTVYLLDRSDDTLTKLGNVVEVARRDGDGITAETQRTRRGGGE